MKGAVNKKGFTLVELSLSLVFIGILSITAVLIINNTMLAYQRGLTLNKINDVGMDLVDDMRTVVQGSPVKLDAGCAGENVDDPSCMYFEQKNDPGGRYINNVPDYAPLYGGFCTGKYSYLWRSGYLDGREVGVKINGDVGEEYWLAKIKDEDRQVCKMVKEHPSDDINFGVVEYEELIPSDSRLAMYDLYVPMPAESDAIKTMFYSISFVLGTRGGGVNIMAEGDYCTPPEGDNSNFNYCAINKFNFAAQAGGMKK